ncbi:MAG: N-acetylmuramoyl-L-alanine amidase [Bacteroidota bacterium]
MIKRKIQITLIACFIFPVSCLFAQINSDSLIAAYTQKIQKYLDKEKFASQCFSFTKNGIEVYSPATDTSQKKIEYIIFWNELDAFKLLLCNYDSRDAYQFCLMKKKNPFSKDTINAIHKRRYIPPKILRPSNNLLAHYKIALDPGHIAGNIETAKMERKWVKIKAKKLLKGESSEDASIQLIEGEITLATAQILIKKLEKEGATVMLTRDKSNQSAFGIEFKKWKDSLFVRSVDSAFVRGDISYEEKNFLLSKANDTEIFRRFFLQEEMYERARKINDFHPDLSIIIHYNVDGTNQNWNKPTKKNFVMAFVGGGFTKDEFEKPEARIEFLRLLLTDDIEQSIMTSKHIVNSLSEKLNIPVAIDSSATYLYDNCMQTDVPGVFCRNLTLTRIVKGTLVYGESLYQDNINECKLLNKKEIMIDEIKTSKRVEEVAESYFEGIMNYVKEKQNK